MIRRLDGLLHGDYRTLFRGFGLDLADLREYQYHDDVRHIDWNVTARLQTPYVREYNEDREVAAWFLLDLSPSVDFGSREREEARGVAPSSSPCWRASSRATATASARCSTATDVDTVIPARSGRRHVLHLLHRMLTRPRAARSRRRPTSASCCAPALRRSRRGARSCSSSPTSSARRAGREPLAHLAQRHEVVAVRLYDPLEMELPDLGLLVVQDAETGEQLFVDTHDRGFRKRFAAAAQRARGGAARGVPRRPASTRSSSSTDDDLVDAILRFADLRKRRSQLAAGGGLPQHLGGMQRMTFLWPRCCGCCCSCRLLVLALRAAAAAEEEGGAALREPRAGARTRWAPASACAATCRRCCSCSRSR